MSFMEFVIAAIGIASAIGVVGFRNPLSSAFSLIVHLLSIAGLYALLGAHFLAVSQVVVYAGAIMVLVLFVLMLLNLKSESGRRLGVVRSAITVGIGLVIFLSVSAPMLAQFDNIPQGTLEQNIKASEGGVKAIGELLYSQYMVQFELSSLVLLVGVVGAVMLAKRKNVQLTPREGGMGGAK
jgi:NADH-quinone oxidoreductase subunit J